MARIKLTNVDEMIKTIKSEKEDHSRDFRNIPEIMRKYDHFVGYVLPSKNPINMKTMSDAKANDPETWTSFDEAVSKVGEACQYYNGKKMTSGVVAGIGFMLSTDDPFVCVDLDHVLTDGEPSEEAQKIVETINSYTEVSCSGTGLHIFAIGQGGKETRKRGGSIDVEMYSSRRYIALTGTVYDGKSKLYDRSDAIKAIHTKYLKKEETKAPTSQSETGSILSDEDVLKKARSMGDAREMFVKLYDNGDMSDHDNDHSRADNALVSILAFWCRDDVTQIDRLFRGSQLMREKWDRPTGSSTYGRMTIDQVIGKPHKTYKGNGRVGNILDEPTRKKEDVLTLPILREYLQESEIAIKYNELTDETEVIGLPSVYKGHETSVLPTIIYDELKLRYKGVTRKGVEDMLNVIRVERKFNPVRNYLNNLTWNRTDYFEKIYAILGVTDQLEKIFIRKWFIQCVAMAFNGVDGEIYGSDGVLVLQGAQGLGKTSFFRMLTPRPEWFREGLDLNLKDKDVIIKATTAWISEMGEFDATTKRDQSNLKAFITNTIDNVRKPYAPTALNKIRCTSFCATVNETEFIRDKTGARRWWIVKINRLDIMKDLIEFSKKKSNIEGLWAQALEEFKKDHTSFRLTPGERKELNGRSVDRLVETPIERVFLDYLDFEAPEDQWDWWTSTELLTNAGELSDQLMRNRADSVSIGKALSTLSNYHDCVRKRRVGSKRETYLPRINNLRKR